MIRKEFQNSYLALAILCLTNGFAFAVDDVAGTLFTLTNTSTAPNGAWSWFEDERVIVDDSDPSNTLLVLSSVSAGSAPENGDIDLLWRNLDSGVQGEFELNNQLEQDDHNSASLYIRPDGRYLAMYSRHITDPLTRWRISTNPHDPTSWGPEQTINNGAGTTYNNTYYLAGDNGGAGRTYNFTRADNFDPVVQVSDNDGTTWTEVGKLLTEGGGGDRPYLRYASDGEKIHFIATERHPRNFQNSVNHGYVQDGVLYNTTGEVIDGNLFDANGSAPNQLTTVFKNGSQLDDLTLTRAWTINLEMDNTGNPVGIISARVNDSNQDHRFLYARYDGAEWQVNQLSEAGGFLYSAETDYTGLAAIDPDNPNVVYMSSDIDPRDSSSTNRYELYKGVTSDFGETWTWSAITENSTVDNLRPAVPEWNGNETAVTWMRGTYNSWTSWNTEVVGVQLAATDPKSLLWRGNSANPSAWDLNSSANWDSGGGVSDTFANGAEVAFDDTADTFTVNLPATVSPSGVAFNNTSNIYNVTGAGIGGSGRLRVIGGGATVLANAPNTYTGETLIARGTLSISGGAALQNTSHIRVDEQGNFDVTAATGGAYSLNGQILTVDGEVNGNIVATNGSTVRVNSANSLSGNLTLQSGSLAAGAGRVTGNLLAENGTVQVGGTGLTVFPGGGSLTPVDDFEGYSVESYNGGSTAFLANGGPWQSNTGGGTGLVAVEDDGSTQHLAFGWSSGQRGASRSVNPIADGSTGTFYFRVRTTDGSPDVSYGLSDIVSGGSYGYGDFEVQIGLVNNNGPILGARDGGSFNQIVNLDPDTWYDIWLVVDNETDTYDAYYGTTGDPNDIAVAIQFADDFGYRNGAASNDLGTFLTLSNNHGDRQAHLDEIFQGTFLPGPTVITGGEILTIDGDLTLQAAASLILDIGDPDVHDQLLVGGDLTAGGTLQVVLADGAPLLEQGDTFDLLLVSGAIQGDFDTYVLPELQSGLVWNVSELSTAGELSVVADVDLNNDGWVSGEDYLIIQRENPSLLTEWQSQFGSKVVSGSLSTIEAVNVPEPRTSLLLGVTCLLLLTCPDLL